jgi:hypothetical protein
VDFVFEDYDATILRAMYNKPVAGVKFNRLAVAGEARHQVGSPSNGHRPTGEVIAGLVDRVIGKRLKIVVAINESLQAFRDDLEEGAESFKSFVSSCWHNQLRGVLLEGKALDGEVYAA